MARVLAVGLKSEKRFTATAGNRFECFDPHRWSGNTTMMPSCPPNQTWRVGAVVIGRNEGERLKECIKSLSAFDEVVYVDSGSTDGSVQWALENGKTADAVPTQQDLLPYFKGQIFPVCPSGGTYTIGTVGEVPTCSIPGHVLSQ